MAEKKEQKVETKKTQKKILKLNLKTFIIIAVTIAIAIITIVVISLVLRNNRIKKETEQFEKDRAYVADLLEKSKNKTNNEEKNIEFFDFVEEGDFKPKTFDKKYTDLYDIVKGSDKTINGIT